jgi:hypothetical protein
MGAGVGDGENLAVQVEQGDPAALNLNECAHALNLFERALGIGKLRFIGDFDEAGYGSSLPLFLSTLTTFILMVCARLLHPKGLGGDIFLGFPTETSSPGRAYSHQHLHLHVAVAEDLARAPYLLGKVPHHEHRQLHLGHHFQLAP